MKTRDKTIMELLKKNHHQSDGSSNPFTDSDNEELIDQYRILHQDDAHSVTWRNKIWICGRENYIQEILEKSHRTGLCLNVHRTNQSGNLRHQHQNLDSGGNKSTERGDVVTTMGWTQFFPWNQRCVGRENNQILRHIVSRRNWGRCAWLHAKYGVIYDRPYPKKSL